MDGKLSNIKEKAYYIHEIITSPKAYSIYATIGVLVTTAVAIAITKKECERKEKENSSEEKIEETKSEATVENVINDILDVAPVYIPVIASAAATVYCIWKSDSQWKHYNNLINTAYLHAQNKMARYRSQVPGVVAGSLVSGLGGRKAEEGKQWYCLKDLSPYEDIYFQATEADIYYAEYHLNRNFVLRGSCSVREFCAFLGVDDQIAKNADYYGWDTEYFYENGLEPWIDFEHSHTEDPETGETINMITFTWSPGFSDDHKLYAYGYGA